MMKLTPWFLFWSQYGMKLTNLGIGVFVGERLKVPGEKKIMIDGRRDEQWKGRVDYELIISFKH